MRIKRMDFAILLSIFSMTGCCTRPQSLDANPAVGEVTARSDGESDFGRTRVDVPDLILLRLAGRYRLELDPPAELVLYPRDGVLFASVVGWLESTAFYPESDTVFYATHQPLEIWIIERGAGVILSNRGKQTRGVRTDWSPYKHSGASGSDRP